MSKAFGGPLNLSRPTPIKADETTLGYGWTLSDEAQRDIEEIERAIVRR